LRAAIDLEATLPKSFSAGPMNKARFPEGDRPFEYALVYVLFCRQSSSTSLVRPKGEAWSEVGIATGDINGPSDPRFLRLRNLAAIEILFATGIRAGQLASLNFNNYRDEEAGSLVKGKGGWQRLSFLPDERSLTVVQKLHNDSPPREVQGNS
jgi:integrase